MHLPNSSPVLYSSLSKSNGSMRRPLTIGLLALFSVCLLLLYGGRLQRENAEAITRQQWEDAFLSQLRNQAEQNAINQEPVVLDPWHWRDYPILSGYYNGIRKLVDYTKWIPEQGKADGGLPVGSPGKAVVPNPYSNLQSSSFLRNHEAVQTCYLDDAERIPAPDVPAYHGIPANMPAPYMGSYEEMGLVPDVCWDRLGRLGPYGYSSDLSKGGFALEQLPEGDSSAKKIQEVDYSKVDWGTVQNKCLEKNRRRFITSEENSTTTDQGSWWFRPRKQGHLQRTAFILRAWTGITWTPMRIMTVRALINELSLKTGGQYDVHILMHVKNDSLPIFSSEELYQDTIQENVPKEFWNITTLWSVPHMKQYYPGFHEEDTIENDSRKPIYSVYRIPHFALQWFAQQHPQYEYFWNWEMDVRYTGHYYDLFHSAERWSQQQPRKYLWERNARFWIPGFHGSYEEFMQTVESETRAKSAKTPWGPTLSTGVIPRGTRPPRALDEDEYEWGVGEQADLITFNPLFDPDKNAWCLRYDITGYNHSVPERRTAIITIGRFSKRLLHTMHEEALVRKHHMFPEMIAGSIALHHGLKAVYVPHPIYFDRRWPLETLNRAFNRPQSPEDSVFYFPYTPGTGEHNFLTSSFYYSAHFGATLWRRWLGQQEDGLGGKGMEEQLGRMCLRGTLIHPVKYDFGGDAAIGGT